MTRGLEKTNAREQTGKPPGERAGLVPHPEHRGPRCPDEVVRPRQPATATSTQKQVKFERAHFCFPQPAHRVLLEHAEGQVPARSLLHCGGVAGRRPGTSAPCSRRRGPSLRVDRFATSSTTSVRRSENLSHKPARSPWLAAAAGPVAQNESWRAISAGGTVSG